MESAELVQNVSLVSTGGGSDGDGGGIGDGESGEDENLERSKSLILITVTAANAMRFSGLAVQGVLLLLPHYLVS